MSSHSMLIGLLTIITFVFCSANMLNEVEVLFFGCKFNFSGYYPYSFVRSASWDLWEMNVDSRNKESLRSALEKISIQTATESFTNMQCNFGPITTAMVVSSQEERDYDSLRGRLGLSMEQDIIRLGPIEVLTVICGTTETKIKFYVRKHPETNLLFIMTPHWNLGLQRYYEYSKLLILLVNNVVTLY